MIMIIIILLYIVSSSINKIINTVSVLLYCYECKNNENYQKRSSYDSLHIFNAEYIINILGGESQLSHDTI